MAGILPARAGFHSALAEKGMTMAEIEPTNLSSVSETLLIPLYYRAVETQRPDAMIKDAEERICRLNFTSTTIL